MTELNVLNALIGQIYDAALEPKSWTSFLASLNTEMNGNGASLFHASATGRADLGVVETVHWDPVWLQKYDQYFQSIDARFDILRVKPDITVATNADLPAPQEFQQSEIYRDYLLPQDRPYFLTLLVTWTEQLRTLITIDRPAASGPFSPDDVQLAELLRPHLQRAFVIHTELHGLRHHAAHVDSILDQIGSGIVLLNEAGEILLINRLAKTIIEADDGIAILRRQLVVMHDADSQILRSVIQQATQTSLGHGAHPGDVIEVFRPSNKRPFTLTVSPIRNLPSGMLPEHACSVVFIADPEGDHTTMVEALQTLYGLTPSEADIASRLAHGQSIEDIASARESTASTVRSQLKRIFQKTETTRQGELIHLLTTTLSHGLEVSAHG